MSSLLHACIRRYSTISRAITRLKNTSEQLTGHSDVLQAQQLVKQEKEDLRKLRHELAEAVSSYEDTQKRLKGLYARKTQVYQDQRRDIATLQAINNEEESLLYQEQTLHSKVEELKFKERECFESLSDGIQISHEKERAQSDRLKYYSRLGSILGAFFGFLSSNFFLRREIRQHNATQSEKMENMERTLHSIVQSSDKEGLAPSLAKTEELDVVSFAQSVQEKLQTNEAKVNVLHNEVTILRDLLDAQNKLLLATSRVEAKKDTFKTTRERVGTLAEKSDSLQDGNFLLGVVIYSIGLALYTRV